MTSVCTGSLVLGAAGLLDGYDATTHWAYTDILPLYGARPVRKRVVVDRNRITAGGVTAGIDFGLHLVAELAGEGVAQAIQLALEYDPEPPYRSGHPDVAPPAVVERVRALMEAHVNGQRTKAKEWAAAPRWAARESAAPLARYAWLASGPAREPLRRQPLLQDGASPWPAFRAARGSPRLAARPCAS